MALQGRGRQVIAVAKSADLVVMERVHICAGTGLTPPTNCAGIGLTPPTSAPGLACASPPFGSVAALGTLAVAFCRARRVLDAVREHEHNHRAILEKELETVGLRYGGTLSTYMGYVWCDLSSRGVL